jgi:hypothetical protein
LRKKEKTEENCHSQAQKETAQKPAQEEVIRSLPGASFAGVRFIQA